MIIDFTIKNFRSLKDETTLSLEASSSKGKADNVFEVTTKSGKKFRLLKIAVIYGANASGKSNIIKAFWSLRQLIYSSYKFDINDEMKFAEPFELSPKTSIQPTEFKIHFIAWDNHEYVYFISYSKNDGIIEESLKYYPQKIAKVIFTRKGRKIISKNKEFFRQNDIKIINPKRLLLSEVGNSGDEYWENLRNYFTVGNSAINSSALGMSRAMTEMAKSLFTSKDSTMVAIKNKVVRLIQLSDLGIKGVDLIEENELTKTSDLDHEESDNESKKQKRFKIYHDVYDDTNVVNRKEFDLIKQGSAGTFTLIGLSTEILVSLSFPRGRPIWVDEIDNSLHPYVCRFLIGLFNHPKSNPNNSQLIFATHETTLLDRNNFRKDQIWITSKDKFGVTKLYSVYDLDVEGLRDDIPFDKWYMSGKFGGIPKIKELDFIFDRKEISADGKKKSKD